MSADLNKLSPAALKAAMVDTRIKAACESIAGHRRFIAAREEDIAARRLTIKRWEGVLADLKCERVATFSEGRADG